MTEDNLLSTQNHVINDKKKHFIFKGDTAGQLLTKFRGLLTQSLKGRSDFVSRYTQ